VPEDREGTAVLGRPVEQPHDAPGRLPHGQSHVPLERRIHDRQRDFEKIQRLVTPEVPRAKRAGDPRAKADHVGQAERRVVGEAECRERRKVPMRVAPQVVVAMPSNRPRKRLQRGLLLAETLGVVGGRVAPVQADLGAHSAQRLHEPRAKTLVRLRRCAVMRVGVACEHKEGRVPCASPSLLRRDLLEAPVRVGTAPPVQRRERKPCCLACSRANARMQEVLLEARRRAAQPDRRPPPRRIDVVGQSDDEGRFRHTELLA